MQRSSPKSEELSKDQDKHLDPLEEERANLAFIKAAKLVNVGFYPNENKVALIYHAINDPDYQEFVKNQAQRLSDNLGSFIRFLEKEGITDLWSNKERNIIFIRFSTDKDFGKSWALIREKIHPILATKPRWYKKKRRRIETAVEKNAPPVTARPQSLPFNTDIPAPTPESIRGQIQENTPSRSQPIGIPVHDWRFHAYSFPFVSPQPQTPFARNQPPRAGAECYGARTSTPRETFGEDIPSELLSAANNKRLTPQSRPSTRTVPRYTRILPRPPRPFYAASQRMFPPIPPTTPSPSAVITTGASESTGQSDQQTSQRLFRKLYGTHSPVGAPQSSVLPPTRTYIYIEDEDDIGNDQPAVFASSAGTASGFPCPSHTSATTPPASRRIWNTEEEEGEEFIRRVIDAEEVEAEAGVEDFITPVTDVEEAKTEAVGRRVMDAEEEAEAEEFVRRVLK